MNAFDLDLVAERRRLVAGAPPDWASEWGEDRLGLFLGFTIGDATQRLRWVPPGQFMMGSPARESGRYDDEGPEHEVLIAQGFWLFETPCTQALWRAVMGENPSRFQSPDRPVENVSWNDAQEFIVKINARIPGLSLSLPSEAQWEYACRAGTQGMSYAGEFEILGENNAPGLDVIAWYGGNSGKDFDLDEGWDSASWPDKQYEHSKAGTRRVKLKKPNAYGLYDMLGNVWEWVEDAWHENYDGAPANGSAWVAEKAAKRVLRGGSWARYARYVRSAYRLGFDPDDRNESIGFRCARVQA